MIKKKRLPAWGRIFFSVRTRILAWYIVLMILSTLVSSMAIRQVLLVRIQEEVEKSVVHEVEELRRLTKETKRSKGLSPRNGIATTFNIFLAHNIPHDDTFFITLLNEQFYQSSPQVLPAPLRPDSELVKYWSRLTKPETGKKVTPTDTFFYVAEPVINGNNRGVFVAAYSINGEYKEANRVVIVMLEVTILVLAIASLLAWLVAGRILAPLHSLTETAHSINESDLIRRTPEQGVDEIAELTITFNRMLDRLQTAFTNQREFINDAGHELRTPITIIRGHLELLGDDPQERRETIELVTDELDRMSRFVDDLLLLAKAEQPDFLTLETVDIGLLTEELYTKAKALAPRDWRLDNKGSGRIVADRHRLTQAIMNLAQNATQHTVDGNVIALGSDLKNSNAYFWVQDTGEGITLVDQQRIFERFARGHASRRRSEGAGLGLSIVQAIALAHGGWVELKSQPGEGSTFTIVIPFDPPQEVVSD
ncbi:ATP-binding protein [Aetokthonos hydrillicola Thurmond2011]|uniref:histidine kinase n=2 Tax=Aetokthonos TaxID=1550243 RepID=A0AAP5I7S5_9CYAN|nr:ATP-binding protein [Aetokthonos hydrillicola]MDR9895329.1 ATP-binding protein [Aetokthonos hydrillicola Thurmond2011]